MNKKLEFAQILISTAGQIPNQKLLSLTSPTNQTERSKVLNLQVGENKRFYSQRTAQQINGREGETATFLNTLLVKPWLEWLPFPPASMLPLDRCFSGTYHLFSRNIKYAIKCLI